MPAVTSTTPGSWASTCRDRRRVALQSAAPIADFLDVTLREVWWAVRVAAGLAVLGFSGWLVWAALHIPLEGGAILFTPLLLVTSLFTVTFGLLLLFPHAFRQGRWGWQLLNALPQLFIGW